MPGLWKEWKAKGRLPTLPTSPSEISPKTGEIPTFPQPRRRGPDGKVENQKQVSHFPTASIPLSTKEQNRSAGGLRPPPPAALRSASVVSFYSAGVGNFLSALDITRGTTSLKVKGTLVWPL
jgi:hypothetical protein